MIKCASCGFVTLKPIIACPSCGKETVAPVDPEAISLRDALAVLDKIRPGARYSQEICIASLSDLAPSLRSARMILDYAFRCGAIDDIQNNGVGYAKKNMESAGMSDSAVQMVLEAYGAAVPSTESDLHADNVQESAHNQGSIEDSPSQGITPLVIIPRKASASGNQHTVKSTCDSEKGDIVINVPLSFDEAYSGTVRKITYTLPSSGETISVNCKIPAGAESGARMRHRGYGDYGSQNGIRGDLLLVIEVNDGPLFGRRGPDVLMDVSLDASIADSGGVFLIPFPGNRQVKLRLPAGVQDGRVFRFRGEGAPDLRSKGQRGDIYVTVRVDKRVEESH